MYFRRKKIKFSISIKRLTRSLGRRVIVNIAKVENYLSILIFITKFIACQIKEVQTVFAPELNYAFQKIAVILNTCKQSEFSPKTKKS